MTYALSRFPLKIQIGSLVIMAGIILALCSAVLWTSRSVSETSLAQADREAIVAGKAGDLDVAVLNARRNEKDFLLRRDAKYNDLHMASMAAANSALDGIVTVLPPGEPRLAVVDTVRKGIADYDGAFAVVQKAEAEVGLTEKDGLLGRLRNSVHDVEAILEKYNDAPLQVLMLMMRRHEKDFLVRKDQKYIDELKKRGTEFDKAILSSSVPVQERAVVLEKMTAYQNDFLAAAQAVLAADAAAKQMSAAYASVEPTIESLVREAQDGMAAAKAESRKVSLAASRFMSAVMAAGFILLVAVGALIARSIYIPLGRMTLTMLSLARGQLDTEIPSEVRRDEIGKMAEALRVFKENSQQVLALRRAQEEEALQSSARRRADREAMASELESNVGTVIGSVAAAAAQLEPLAQGMSGVSEETVGLASSVAAASEQAASNVQTVAAASEQLSASSQEIADQVNRATDIALLASNEAAKTDELVRGLSEAAAKIGDVVSLISDIAARPICWR